MLDEGIVHADKTPTSVMDGGAMLVLDGEFGFGQTIGPIAVDRGIDRCREHGLSAVALRHSGHLGRIGAFAEQAAAADLVSIHIVNVANSRLVAPFGSAARRMGTNPYAFGVPRPDHRPVIHDFATSIVAEGKTAVAAQGGPPVPDDALVGPNGITGDPAAPLWRDRAWRAASFARRARRAPGDGQPQRFGPLLSCANCSPEHSPAREPPGPTSYRSCNGMLSIYIDPERIDVDDTFAADVTAYTDWYLDAEPLDTAEPVLLPGDREHQRRTERMRDGLDLPGDLWTSICAAAAFTGTSLPELEVAPNGSTS